jgi:transposase
MIVMGLDQHRGQITGEWIDLETGEVQRTRVAPADRAAVRKFLRRFRGRELEVALEATTGWRFVIEELRRIGAVVHLAEPAETAGLRGPKRRAKGDRADARHLRELLMVKRLPESWIPPDHILDLRARVRQRHTLSEQRSEWQQRIQATLYDHGCPRRRSLLVGDGRAWLASQPLSAAARQTVAVALAMIDALEAQIALLDRELWAYARRQAGCKALMAHYGIGELVAVTILAELGDCTRFSSSRQAVRYGGMDITVHQSDQHRAPGHLSRQGPPTLRWALFEAAQQAPRQGIARPSLLRRGGRTARAQPRVPVGRAQAPEAQLPHAARARRGGAATRMSFPPRAKPFVTQMRRGQLPRTRCRHAHVDGPERPSGRNATPSGITPSNIMSPAPEPTRGSRTEVSPGARAQNTRTTNHAHAPPAKRRSPPTTRTRT